VQAADQPPGIAVLGAGSWGTALAVLLARNGHRCVLWGHHRDHIAQLAASRTNARYLPGIPFPDELRLSDDLRTTVGSAGLILVAVPSHAFRDVLGNLAAVLGDRTSIAWATKGLEIGTGHLLHQVVADLFGRDTEAAVVSGPTFAAEVAAGLPTAVTVASQHPGFARNIARLLHNDHFRAYTSDDLIGVELGGATKNVLAIAAGVADGLGFGANTRSALITRGLAEMMRLGLAMGGKSETLMGLSGVGDLILTCTDDQSRNRRFGLGLGRGRSRDEIVAGIGQEIEGIGTARLVYQLSRDHGIEMPITEQVFRILYQQLAPVDAVRNLLLREQKAESNR
jgi:glycerol-3-phosphate dehydrogenase (NAD(P)+)